jgi:hypothetical protein
MRGPKPSSIAPWPCARRERSLHNDRPAPPLSQCAKLPRRLTARLRLRRSVVRTWTARPRLCRGVVRTWTARPRLCRGVVRTSRPRHRRPRRHAAQPRRPAARPCRPLCPDGHSCLAPSPSRNPWPSRRCLLPPRFWRKARSRRLCRHRALGCRALLRLRRALCRFSPNRGAPSFSIDCAREPRHSRRRRSNRS